MQHKNITANITNDTLTLGYIFLNIK